MHAWMNEGPCSVQSTASYIQCSICGSPSKIGIL